MAGRSLLTSELLGPTEGSRGKKVPVGRFTEAVDFLVCWTVRASSGRLFVCFSILKIESKASGVQDK